ncbi:hypothetical protein DRO19_03805 [Candidatus Bathyarchaeota archaeon]|nr:MAG: hypothetical protein DRO19_03805 [Candidatus Bathyarchaeota archaeon]
MGFLDVLKGVIIIIVGLILIFGSTSLWFFSGQFGSWAVIISLILFILGLALALYGRNLVKSR